MNPCFTLAATGTAEVAGRIVSQATTAAVAFFHRIGLVVSFTKSLAVASQFKLAKQVARTTRGIVNPKRSVKLLGTGAAGGVRRTMATHIARQRFL